jgi:hypothetical protein
MQAISRANQITLLFLLVSILSCTLYTVQYMQRAQAHADGMWVEFSARIKHHRGILPAEPSNNRTISRCSNGPALAHARYALVLLITLETSHVLKEMKRRRMS